jgi:hypothetical protein
MIEAISLRFKMVLFGLFVMVVGVYSPRKCVEGILEVFGQ